MSDCVIMMILMTDENHIYFGENGSISIRVEGICLLNFGVVLDLMTPLLENYVILLC